MANFPTETALHHFDGADGARMAWHGMGPEDGRPVILIHGLFSNAFTNWVRYGHAAKLAAKGRRVIMPDLRAHGDSAKPHDPSGYSEDILADDNLALIEQLGLAPGGYDLGGYSLGGRTTARMLVRGAKPGKALLAGMGLEGLLDLGGRVAFFRKVLEGVGTHPKFSPEWMAEGFLKTTGGDARALLLLLDNFPKIARASLADLAMPILVLTGSEDNDNGSARALAAALPNAGFVEVPGNHMSAVTLPQLGDAIADWF
ncbi:alpha/beta hydrolase [Rhizorhabdus wittichii DC-6]|uniref:Alpha/beta hydrolase fold n=1 Tax=Rhizorhabdus wittichii (strain DSM 6014 / CCUG 31198 / JCM 15750 / NBRC 105917 / EY 4224 / RW1) TaxID=392499 RepID=A0A9J9HCL2_RHIWR|nr:alpha/beta fold hydrolase [Rhizorhabdus wittichii]ABQ69022.1 alpha/beta hydrolase fold [Rhizorhabdus wittichii RW1]ARR54140.1 alpha/beta hydrolase [Rhizorhabdus wittichii DC-6]